MQVFAVFYIEKYHGALEHKLSNPITNSNYLQPGLQPHLECLFGGKYWALTGRSEANIRYPY